MAADPNAMAAELLKNPQFLEMFQKAMGDGGKIPDEKDPGREQWLRNMQARLAEEQSKEAKKRIEEPVTDAEGQWMWIVPEPGFCIKCATTTGDKVFINICKHPKIAEPIPLEPEETDESDTIKFKIPLSCGQVRFDTDKSGKPCKVYDVVVNPNTVTRCGEDSEFRRFLAALSMTWIKQKSEPHLDADEFKNINIKVKGKPDLQRIRLSDGPRAANALNDELKLPSAAASASAPAAKGGAGGRKLVQEIEPETAAPAAGGGASTGKKSVSFQDPAAPRVAFTAEGAYDWSAHAKPGRHPHFREQVPESFALEAFIPVQTIKEVDVRVLGKRVDFFYVDNEDGRPFMTCALPYHVDEDPVAAKFVRKTQTLSLRLKVRLPDEVAQEKTNVVRCAVDEEEEERRKRAEAEEAALKEQREKYDRIKAEEQRVMAQRRELVENLNAMSAGEVPPALRSELDGMPNEQLHGMLVRIEGRIKRGDSVDALIERLPPDALDSIADYIRAKLGLEAAKRAPPPPPKPAKPAAVVAAEEKGLMAPVEDEGAATVEFNFAKKAEQLCGVLMNNRYLFALDH